MQLEADQAAAPSQALLHLLELARRARHSASAEELAFLAVNDSHILAPYRQAALWFEADGVRALSGVVEAEANAPYAHWIDAVCRHLHGSHAQAAAVEAVQLPAALAGDWAEWLPPYGLWLPFSPAASGGEGGGLLLAADQPWPEHAIALMREWQDAWLHAWTSRQRASASPWRSWRQLRRVLARRPGQAWWRQPRWRLAAAVLLLLLLPVRLTVLAPGELVPKDAATVRAPLDGVLGRFEVQPNQAVKAGQLLFSFDEAQLAARRDVAAQALAAAQAEYRQFAQQALSDPRSKAQLAILSSKIEEKRAEDEYVGQQLARARVTAPQDGVALFDDPGEWLGKPVQMGERIMRVAMPEQLEVEAWLPIGDAIPLPERGELNLYLAASPLSAIPARLRYVAHEASLRPDGSYAYRVRATLDAPTAQRVGLKGTARLSGGWVPLAYWLLRRPLATVRQALGL